MNLCIDVGNTQAKLGVFRAVQSEQDDLNRNLIDFIRLDDLTIAALEDIFLKYNIRHAILSSTRGEHVDLMTFMQERLNMAIKLSSQIPVPITSQYQTPKTLGNDRLAGAVAATVLFPNEHVLVVDAGTCITYDFVTAEKVYMGGSILPGIEMRFNAMQHFTAKLPLVEMEELETFIGTSTKTSMQTGVLQGVLHELRGFKTQYGQEFGNIRVIVTGGDASYFESQLKNEIFAQPKLVLVGLNRILDYNINRTD